MSLNRTMLGGSPGRFSIRVKAALALFSPSQRTAGASRGMTDQPGDRIGVGDEHFMDVATGLGSGGEPGAEPLRDPVPCLGLGAVVAVEERYPGRRGLLRFGHIGHMVDQLGRFVHRGGAGEEDVQLLGAVGRSREG